MRSKKLIHQGLQFRLTAKFVGVALLAMAIQFLFLGYRLVDRLDAVAGRGGDLTQELPGVLLATFGLSLVLILPSMAAIGILLTFRVAGPVYRFECYLKSLAEDGYQGPCKIRDGDELQSLCTAINSVTARFEEQDPRDSIAESTESGPIQQAA